MAQVQPDSGDDDSSTEERILHMPLLASDSDSRRDQSDDTRLKSVAHKTRTELRPVFMVLPKPWISTALLAIADLCAITLAAIGAYLLRDRGGRLDLELYLQAAPILLIVPVLFAWRGLYRSPAHPPAMELRIIVSTLAIAFLAITALMFMIEQSTQWSRSVWAWTGAFAALFIPLFRGATRGIFARRKWWGAPAAILGAGKTGQAIIRQLQRNPGIGMKPVACFDDNPSQAEGNEVLPYLGRLEKAADFAARSGVKTAILAMPGAPGHRLLELERKLQDCYPDIIIIPPYVGYLGLWVEARDLGGAVGLKIQRQLLLKGPRRLKAFLEWIVVLIGLPFAAMVGALIALAVKLDSRGPIFYKQDRLGVNGTHFGAYKFRSMHGDGEQRLKELFAKHPELKDEYEINHKLRDDPRVTRVGRIIRKLSLDELPQLINFLRGEVALIGPRAYLPRELIRMGPQAEVINRIKPGITGLWQVSGRSETTFEERVAIESYYVHNWSPWLDAWILGKTISAVAFGKGAY